MKKIISLIMIVTILMCSSVMAGFTDVTMDHWAFEHIFTMEYYKIINGYEDGTFKPNNNVKTGEFIKMTAMALWPEYEYKAPETGTHWAMPYVNSLNRIVLSKSDYDAARLERIITRAEATRILANLYVNLYTTEKLDTVEEYVQNFADSANITSWADRRAIDECVRFGLINGFEDNTFRPTESLTRAQAAKILSIAICGE